MYPLSTVMPMHDESSVDMTPEPSQALADARASPCLSAAAGGSSAPALGPAERERVAAQLRNPHYRFSLSENQALVSMIWAAAPTLRTRHWPSLVWCQLGQPIPRPEPQQGEQGQQEPCVLVAPFYTQSGWELHAALASDLGAGPSLLPAHLPSGCRFPCPPHDIFDVIAQTMNRARSLTTQGSSLEAQRRRAEAGWPLRQELADWLEAPPGRTLPTCVPRALGDASTAADPVRPRPVPPQSPERPIAVAPLMSESLRHRTLALAGALRQGLWSEDMSRLVPILMARLPPKHPLSLPKLEITMENQQILRINAGDQGQRTDIHCDAQGWHVGHMRNSEGLLPITFRGPDALLRALDTGLNVRPEEVSNVRHLLADLIERHPVVAALVLAINDRWPLRDPEVLLRFCLHGTTLQRAGHQLLDDTRPQRDLCKDDLLAWLLKPISARLDYEDIARQGLSVADARWLMSPLGLSQYGEWLMYPGGRPAGHTSKRAHAPAIELLKTVYPQLRYEFGSADDLCVYLRLTCASVKRYMGEPVMVEARQYRERMIAESVLRPAGPEPREWSTDWRHAL